MVTKLLFLLFFLWPFNIFWPANNLDNLKTASNIPTTTLPPTRVTSACVNPCRIWCAWWNMNSGGLLFICCRLAATITSRGRQTWGYRTKIWANQRKSARRSSNETLTTRTKTIQHLYNKRSLSENCLPHPYNYSPSYTCDIRICRSMPHLMKHELKFGWWWKKRTYLLHVSHVYYMQIWGYKTRTWKSRRRSAKSSSNKQNNSTSMQSVLAIKSTIPYLPTYFQSHMWPQIKCSTENQLEA